MWYNVYQEVLQEMNVQQKIRLGAADIAATLRREICSGNLAKRDRLPPERRLSKSFGVARGTIREALIQLVESGHVEVRQGSDTGVEGSRYGGDTCTSCGGAQ
mgnify:CR=1 FL=1